MDRTAKGFATLLSEQLLGDPALKDLCHDKLHHVLKASVETIAEGELRKELADNFEEYFKQLQRSLAKKRDGSNRKRRTRNGDDILGTSLDKRPLLVLGELDKRLQEIRLAQNFSQQCDQYVQALCASCTNAEWQIAILQDWIEHWNADAEMTIEDATKITSSWTALTDQEVKLKWLKLCLKMFTRFLDSTASKGLKDDYHGRVKQLMWSCLYSCRSAVVIAGTSCVKSGLYYEDLMSALLSVYTEYVLVNMDVDHMTTMPSHVTSLLHMLLGHSQLHYLDVILQISVCKLPHHSIPILLSVCSYVLEKTVDCPMDHHSYVKFLCCIITANGLSAECHSAKFKVKRMSAAPKGFVQWLHKSSPSLAKKLNLTHFTPDSNVDTTVMCCTAKNIIEDLLILVDSKCVAEGTINLARDADSDVSPLVEVDQQPSLPISDATVNNERNEIEDGILSDEDLPDGHSLQTGEQDRSMESQTFSAHKRLSGGKRGNMSSGVGQLFYVDTTPGHDDHDPPITLSAKKKRRSWRTPQRTRYYMKQ